MIFKSISFKNIMRRLSVFILSLFTTVLFAQQIPLNQFVQNRLNQLFITADSSVYTSFRNTNWLEWNQLHILHKNEIIDSVFGLNANENGSYFFNHFTTDNWIKAAGNNNILAVDPVFEGTVCFSSEKNNPLYSGAAG